MGSGRIHIVALGVLTLCYGGLGCRQSGNASDIRATLRTNGAIIAKPVAGDGTLVIRSMDGVIRCVLPQTGQPLWAVGGYEFSDRPACIVRGSVVFPCQSGLCGARINDGRVVWTLDEVGPSTPVTDGRMVYCLGRDVYEIDPVVGSVTMRVGISPSTDCKYPAVSGGTLYFPGADGFFYAVSAESGVVLWKTLIGTWKCGTPVATTAIVAFAAMTGRNDGSVCLRVLEAKSGRLRWQAELKAMNWQLPPCATETSVVLGTDKLIAFNLSDGTRKWVCDPGSSVVSGVVPMMQHAFLCGLQDGTLLSVDAASGRGERIAHLKGGIWATPVVEGRIAGVGDATGEFIAVDLTTGSVMWQLSREGGDGGH